MGDGGKGDHEEDGLGGRCGEEEGLWGDPGARCGRVCENLAKRCSTNRKLSGH